MIFQQGMKVRNIQKVIVFNIVKYDLPAGDYRFEWVYTYKNVPGYNISAEIKWIEYDGMIDGQLQCDRCLSGYSNEGSDDCKTCDAFTYFDSWSQKV